MKLSICNKETAFIFTTDTKHSQLVAMVENGEEVVIEFNGEILNITATETGLHVNERKKNGIK